MSKLFETMTAINKQHANAGDAGQYKYTAPFKDYSEPAPTVSLYNLLDYSPAQLDHIHNVLMLGIAKLDSIKLSKSETYQDATAFARILETLMKEKNK